MKRQLFESTKALPYTSGQVIDRIHALSSIFCFNVTVADEGSTAKISVTHSDSADSAFTDVTDERIFMDDTNVEKNPFGKIIRTSLTVPVSAGELLNVDVDLLGCKRYVKFNVAYTKADGSEAAVTASYLLVLGDFNENPILN